MWVRVTCVRVFVKPSKNNRYWAHSRENPLNNIYFGTCNIYCVVEETVRFLHQTLKTWKLPRFFCNSGDKIERNIPSRPYCSVHHSLFPLHTAVVTKHFPTKKKSQSNTTPFFGKCRIALLPFLCIYYCMRVCVRVILPTPLVRENNSKSNWEKRWKMLAGENWLFNLPCLQPQHERERMLIIRERKKVCNSVRILGTFSRANIFQRTHSYNPLQL